MNRSERLLNSLLGKPVDRPAVNFYETGGFVVDPLDKDIFNVYNSDDWQAVLKLANTETDLTRFILSDLICMDLNADYLNTAIDIQDKKKIYNHKINCGDKILSGTYMREADIDTLWCTEHFLKDESDIESFLNIPDEPFIKDINIADYKKIEQELGTDGIIMIDIGAPVSEIAQMMDLTDFWVMALQKEKIIYKFLDKISRIIYNKVKYISNKLPNRLWRIVGPEVACQPYLPSWAFEELVVKYTKPMIDIIKGDNGFVRMHCHGRVKSTLPMMIDMGIDAIDPLEPYPQGDVNLRDVRREYGRDITLFGNIEACDIENLAPDKFRELAKQSVDDGTFGEGRGFVLMPSASPYGRKLSSNVLANYRSMIDAVKGKF